MPSYVLYVTSGGSMLLQDGRPVAAEGSDVRATIERAKGLGVKSLKVSDPGALELARAAGLEASSLSAPEVEELNSRRLALLVESGLASDEASAIQLVRSASISAAEQAIREASSRPDLQVVQAVQALDETDKFLNITATRVSEWYGLHFPEVLQLVPDNLMLCKLVAEVGRRESFTAEALAGRGFSDKKLEALTVARDRSKGGEMSDRDLGMVRALAALAGSLSSERDRLNGYVESAMRRIAPNVAEVAGATIGARLMARAGGLERLAMLPASTIQVLGAEKALFRSLKTGARPPKHGILFQHQDVHTAPKWQRGKIARTLANKIAIAARIDFYRGKGEPTVRVELDKRLEQIRTKYKEPPKLPERRQKRRR